MKDKFTTNWNDKLSQQISDIQLDIAIILLDKVNLTGKRSKCVIDNTNGVSLY